MHQRNSRATIQLNRVVVSACVRHLGRVEPPVLSRNKQTNKHKHKHKHKQTSKQTRYRDDGHAIRKDVEYRAELVLRQMVGAKSLKEFKNTLRRKCASPGGSGSGYVGFRFGALARGVLWEVFWVRFTEC